MKTNLTASTLRVILIFSLLLIVGLAGAGFYIAQTKLTEYATTISQLNAQANSGDENIAQLKKIQTYLDDHRSVINKATSIVADSQSYAYQDQIIDDIVTIGNQAHIPITGFDFSSASESGDSSSAPSTPAPSTSSTSAATGSSIKSTVANVTINSTANYDDILNFIKGIERNPTKMQIQEVSLVKDKGNNVTSKSFSIEVYIR